ncbi:MAG: hypothetical protein Q4G54_04585 [Pelistega sp.]|nr:hypothetical protein [Pelistega sp.]
MRLNAWLGKHDPSPEVWLKLQASYDLWQASQRIQFNITPARYNAA